jgi:transcriptional regulator with XRE-family HTH domain/archaellum biogenesis ATPase FlaH
MRVREAAEDLVSTGISHLDNLLGHLRSGDNVIWLDPTGNLAVPFSQSFILASQALGKPVLYVTFDIPPRELFSQLRSVASNCDLTILDCFTWGKGKGADVYLAFYYEDRMEYPGRILRVDQPHQMKLVAETLWGAYESLEGRVHLVFDSLSGMKELWSSERDVLTFYGSTCPKLYELNTVSYWIVKHSALSSRVQSRINIMAQVVLELSMRRGKNFLSTVKAEEREISPPTERHKYWTENGVVAFEAEKHSPYRIELWRRLKQARKMRGISQAELAKLAGVTPSTISQIESDMIMPSLYTLFKLADVLSVKPSFFLQEGTEPTPQLVFSSAEAKEIALPHILRNAAVAKALTPLGSEGRGHVYLIEIPPGSSFAPHFFIHKGEELGCLLSGKLQFFVNERAYKLTPGDVVHLTTEVPDRWENTGSTLARLLWIIIGADHRPEELSTPRTVQ